MAYDKILETKLNNLISFESSSVKDVDLLDTISIMLDKIALDKRLEGFRMKADEYRNSAKSIEEIARSIESINK
jgi:hypothetical protein